MNSRFFQINKKGNRKILYGVIFIILLMLSGCDNPSSGDITDAINENINKEKTCYSLQDNNVKKWPLRVRRTASWDNLKGDETLDPILAAMEKAGYLAIFQETVQRGWAGTVTFDIITPTDEAKQWWDTNHGFCVGSRKVAEILEWSIPTAKGATIQATYTWKLDSPSWADRDEFKNIKGLGWPVISSSFLRETNKGWKAM